MSVVELLAGSWAAEELVSVDLFFVADESILGGFKSVLEEFTSDLEEDIFLFKTV